MTTQTPTIKERFFILTPTPTDRVANYQCYLDAQRSGKTLMCAPEWMRTLGFAALALQIAWVLFVAAYGIIIVLRKARRRGKRGGGDDRTSGL